MLCSYCKVNECPVGKRGVHLKYCSKKCQSADTIQKRKQTNIDRYGVDNPSKSSTILAKRAETNITRFGTANTSSLPAIQEKQKATCLEKYGVEYASQAPEVQQRIKDSWSKYNNSHPWSDPTIREKRKATLLDKYGVEHPIQCDAIAEKMHQTCFELYGEANAAKSPIISQKISAAHLTEEVMSAKKETSLIRYGVENFQQKHITFQLSKLDDSSWLSDKISELGQSGVAKVLNVSVDTVRKYVLKYNIQLPSKSSFESQVVAFIQSQYNGTITLGSREFGKELDIYLPDIKVAIECNGTYWHSELNGRTRSYHLDKTNMCSYYGISLVHVWEHDWESNAELIKSRLLAKIGLLQKIPARKCKVKDISVAESKTFLNNNHIQGAVSASINLGLYLNDELVAVMTFGKSRFNKGYEYELLRFANKISITVIGGASKLFSAFKKKYAPASIISYSDKSFNTGNMYSKLGFTYSHSSAPAYYYTKNYKLIENRVKYQKHKLKDILPIFDSELSEWDNMQLNGYDRIWDCGTDVWVLRNTPN